jgi:hypothetical protein
MLHLKGVGPAVSLLFATFAGKSISVTAKGLGGSEQLERR